MTTDNDLAKPWFQPSVPPNSPPERDLFDAAQQSGGGARHGGDGPMTTRVAGELSLDEVSAPAPRPPGGRAAPERVEVTQPYIPTIGEHAPDFAKRSGSRARKPPNATPPNATPPASAQPASGAAPSAPTSVPPAAPASPAAQGPVERLPLMSEIAAADPTALDAAPGAAPAAPGQGALTQPGDFAPTPPAAQTSPVRPQPPAPDTGKQARPPKRRSLARRVVRRIIGPDLLRKDPPKKK